MMSSLPESQDKQPMDLPSDRLPCRSMVQLFRETFLILGKYFIIVYPVFLYFIISSMIIPRSAPDLNHWAWWIIMAGLIAILFIFQAGWNVMMHKAIKEWKEAKQKQKQKDPEQQSAQMAKMPFGLLKHFIPAMGEYGLSFLLGGFIWLLLSSIPALLLFWVGYQYIGIPQLFTSIMDNPNMTAVEMQKLVKTISSSERAQIYNWNMIFLAILVLSAVVNWLTLFWQQYIVIRNCNPLKAFMFSARHVIKHPFKTFAIMIYFSFFYLFFSLISGLNEIIAMVGNFLLILTIVFFGLFTFLYLADLDESPQT